MDFHGLPEPEPTQKQAEMASVLFLDIVSYSLQPMDKQSQLIMQLQDIVKAAEQFKMASRGDGRLSLPTGDGMAIVFLHDPVAPVRCAIEISQTIKRGSSLPLRMGVHIGPVYRHADIKDEINVVGGGINIAQRIMDCGDAGHILLSSATVEVLRQVSASWSSSLHDLGEVEVKHGVRVHLYNLYTEEVGNRQVPRKLLTAQKTALAVVSRKKRKKLSIGVIAVAALVALAVWWFLYPRQSVMLKKTDTIVLGDFANATGDPVFNDTLRQGLAIQLAQSPFLKIISEAEIQKRLRLMRLPPESRLTPEIARDLCQRTGSAAVIDGSIVALGNQYIIGLKAVTCRTGDSLAQEQQTAANKEGVLKALGDAAAKLRAKLGESLSTVQKFDTPLKEATTPSLEALQAYSLAGKGGSDPIPMLQRAIQLDPNFAMAYLYLGVEYANRGENSLSTENARKAYNLREHVSPDEKFRIEAEYSSVDGDLEAARRVHEIWVQAYPRNGVAHNNLGVIYNALGQHDKAIVEKLKYLQLGGGNYDGVIESYLFLNRLRDAQSVAKEALATAPEELELRTFLYLLAFLENDSAAMAAQVAGSQGILEEGDILYFEAETAGYFGRLRKAREFSRGAVDVAKRAGLRELAAGFEAEVALREALFGNSIQVRELSAAALALSNASEVQFGAALALALAGDLAKTETLANDLAKRYPQNTLVRFNYLPTLRAQLALHHTKPAKAIETLQVAIPYELGVTGSASYSPDLYPAYIRGEAFLAANRGAEAAAEFRRIMDHPGVVLIGPIGALARLGVARAHALEGDRAKARTSYNDFFTLWKNADSDIPILKQAQAEYAKLQ
jgi:class 3 adenylate cyclase/tetratricopeptide (TPR) repeat protein